MKNFQNILFALIRFLKIDSRSGGILFSKILKSCTAVLLSAAVFLTLSAEALADQTAPVQLTAEERNWLLQNPDKLTLYYNVEFPPVEFASDSGAFIGLGADIIALIEKNLGIKFLKTPSRDWNKHLAALRSGECAVAPTIVSTPERERYALFTTPYAVVPVVMITSKTVQGRLTIDGLNGRRVAVVSGYATEKYVREKSHNRFDVMTVDNVSEGLRAVAFGQADVLMENLAVASFVIGKQGISNLRVAGNTDFVFAWSVGVSRQYPLLYSAIQKALDAIPPDEIERVRKRWISLSVEKGLDPQMRRLLIIIAIFTAFLITGLAVISLVFKHRLNEKVASLKAAQQRLLDQSEMLRLATEATQAGIWDSRPATQEIYLSSQWLAMLGYAPEDKTISLTDFDYFVHPEDRHRLHQFFLSYLAGGGATQFEAEYRFRRADGSWCWVLSKGKAVEWDDEKKPSRVIGLDLNIQKIKEDQEKMAQNEAWFRAIFENAPYSIVINRLEDGVYLDANRVFLDRWQLSKEELPYLKSEEFLIIRQDETEKFFNTLLKTGAVQNREVEARKKDGTNAYLLFSSVLLDVRGQKQILSMTTDVTERKLAEEALKESEARIREIIDNAPFGAHSYQLDDSGRLIFIGANPAADRILGIDHYPLLGKTIEEAFPMLVKSGILQHYRDVAQTGRRWEEEVLFYKDKNISGAFDVFAFQTGPGRMTAFFHDITERKKAEDAIRASEARYRRLYNSMMDAYVRVAMDGSIRECNKAYLDMTGYGADEIVNLTYQDITAEKWRAGEARIIAEQVLTRGFSDTYEKEYIRKDGAILPVELRTYLLRDDEGKPAGMWAIIRDITERKQAEEENEKLQGQMLQSQKLEAVGVLAGGVAHDFNNILSAIIGYTELIMGKMDPSDPNQKHLAKILDAAQRSVNLTRQLLAFARKQTIVPIMFDINESIGSLLKMIRRLIGENIELAWLPAPGPCFIRMDPSQFDQTLLNLCVNARDAIATVGRISIQTGIASFDRFSSESGAECLPGEFVLLSVSDTGCGMDQETLHHIFEPFFTTKGVGEGTGMGLATVYGIVKQNNGFINVDSEPGRGTTFKIYIPRHDIHEQRSARETTADIPRSRGETVLLVEDDPTVLEMSMMMLQHLGYVVIAAHSPKEAIRIARENGSDISLFIIDVVMPEMNGRELAERLQEIRPGVKHLFMSGYTADVIAHQGVLDEGINFIHKPFTLKDLAIKIRDVLK